MYGAMIHYYFFKDVIENLDNSVKTKLEYDDNLIFNFANFNSSPSFYKLFNFIKNDKYSVQDYFDKEDCNSIIVESAINLEKNNDYKKLLFLYGMIAHKTLNNYLYPYINSLKSNTYSFNTGLNMIDFYYSKRNGMDVTKESIYKKFKDSFVYYDYMDELIRYPMVKICKLMASETYFTKCYKRKKKFYKKFAKVKYKIVWLKFISLFFHKNGIAPKEFPYRKNVDTNLLNMKKIEFQLGENIYNDNIDELINKALKDTLNRIKAVNDYLFSHVDKNFRKIYNISLEKKL